MKTIEELCDEYSENILKRSGKFVYSGNNPTLIIPSDEERLEHQLELDGYLKLGKNNIYHLTGEGRIFLERGGYRGLKNRIIQKEKVELEQLQSVIDTNSSVKQSIINQELYAKRTIIALIITIAVSAISAIISLCTLLDQSIEKKLQKQVESLQQISHTLKEFSQKEEKRKGDTLSVSLIIGFTKQREHNTKAKK